MPYEIETKDGIVIRNIPDDIPPDHPSVKDRVLSARKQNIAATIENDPISRGARDAQKRSTIEEMGRQTLLTGRYGLEGLGGGVIADKLDLPKPEGKFERVIGDAARSMATGGLIGGIATKSAAMLSGVPNAMAKMLAANPGQQAVASALAGTAGGAAREGGYGEAAQILAPVAAGIVVPLAGGAVKHGVEKLGGKVVDAASTVGAAFGNRRAIDRIAGQAIREVAGETAPLQEQLLRQAKEHVPGVKPHVAEVLAEANKRLGDQIGGKTIRFEKDLTGAKGIEDVLLGDTARRMAKVKEFGKEVDEVTAPLREMALRRANANGVDGRGVLEGIDSIRSDAQNPIGSMRDKILSRVYALVEKNVDPETGKINADTLYALRKDEIGKLINKLVKPQKPSDEKYAGALLRNSQKLIDKAIKEAGGGKEWDDYLAMYSEGMRRKDAVLNAMKSADEIAGKVKSSSPQEIARGDLPTIPNMLSRPVAWTNAALRAIARDANTPVTKRIAEAMTDPEVYARYLQMPETNPLGKQAREIAQRAAIAATAYQMGAQ